MLGVPDDLAIIDIILFGIPQKPPYQRWKKALPQIMSWDRFDIRNYKTIDQIDDLETRQVMYRDEAKVD